MLKQGVEKLSSLPRRRESRDLGATRINNLLDSRLRGNDAFGVRQVFFNSLLTA
jgi:hypothetical protein